MIRQSSSAGLCKYLHNQNKKLCKVFAKERRKKKDIWKNVATDELIIKGFCQCDYIECDGETSNLHSKLQETIKKRKVPEEVIHGINKFLKEMLALQLDEESPDEEVELTENCTANVNHNDHGESDEENYSEENEEVENDDDEINAVDLQ